MLTYADRMVVEILLDVTLGMNFLHSQVSPACSRMLTYADVC
jgi:hypothetical protein